MTCDRLPQLHAFHDDELSPADRDAFETHLKACPVCKAELATLRMMSRRIEEAELEPMPARLVGQILAARRAESGQAILRISSWMTAVAATVLIAALLYGSGETESNTELASGNDATALPTTTWETAALVPPTESRAEVGSEVALVAQWMSDGLSGSDR